MKKAEILTSTENNPFERHSERETIYALSEYMTCKPRSVLKINFCFNSIRILVIGLKFGGMMHSMMKQIAFKNGHVWPIVGHSTELWSFPWLAWARNLQLRKSYYGLKLCGMVQFTIKRIIVWNGHNQLIFAFSDLGRPRVLSFSECLAKWSYISDCTFV